MTSDDLGVFRGKTSTVFGLRQAFRSLSSSEEAEVLLCSGVPERAEAEMAQKEDG